MPKKKPLTPEQLENKYWEVMAENYKRQATERLRLEKLQAGQPEPAKIPKGSNHTRSGYAFARQNPRTTTDVVRPIDLTSKVVNFLPVGSSGCYDVSPVFSTKNVVEYWVILKRGKREMLVARGFTKCCSVGTHCQRDRCAKCWVLKQKEKPGWRYLVREVITNTKPKVVDRFGIDPKGRRAMGKDMDQETRSRFGLTSSMFHYKKGSANWK